MNNFTLKSATLQYYLAPMEGLTTYIFRNAYQKYFGLIDCYFTPFLSGKKLGAREKNEILPEHNKGLTLVPQVLTNRVDEFLSLATLLADYGYSTVNLNLGCPSGTVTAKKRGSGFLSEPNLLDQFLSEIFEHSPIAISIKTRIGISEPEEWVNLLRIYKKYPIKELIIHPRLKDEYYQGKPHQEAFTVAGQNLTIPLCYNGDICSVNDMVALLQLHPQLQRVMIGRGILKNPFLLSDICTYFSQGSQSEGCSTNQTPPHLFADKIPNISSSVELLRSFHDEIYIEYQKIMSGEQPVLYKMKDLWTFLCTSFPNSEKNLKQLRKANHFSDYEIAVNHAFQQYLEVFR